MANFQRQLGELRELIASGDLQGAQLALTMLEADLNARPQPRYALNLERDAYIVYIGRVEIAAFGFETDAQALCEELSGV